MQDPRLRHRRRALGWTLLVLGILPLLPPLIVMPFLELDRHVSTDLVVHSWAALTGFLLIALALLAAGAYLLRTEGRR